MAKKDVIKQIMEENPEKEYDAELLEKENTEKELNDLRQRLAAEKEGADKALTDEEKAAIEVRAGEAGKKKYKLADPNTSYQEPGFTLIGEQSKPLPANPSIDLATRIGSGFIVEDK